ITRDATSELVPQAIAKGIDLGFEGSGSGSIILGDAENLYELCINFIENAILYTQRGGKVTVRLENPSYPCLVVEDNGPGIPPEERERVFERFYRTLGTTVSGSGLGLAIVREIAEMHGAKVSIAGGMDGTGTIVAVQFPQAFSAPFMQRSEAAFVRGFEPPFVRS